jgi:hypothetical protein
MSENTTRSIGLTTSGIPWSGMKPSSTCSDRGRGVSTDITDEYLIRVLLPGVELFSTSADDYGDPHDEDIFAPRRFAREALETTAISWGFSPEEPIPDDMTRLETHQFVHEWLVTWLLNVRDGILDSTGAFLEPDEE